MTRLEKGELTYVVVLVKVKSNIKIEIPHDVSKFLAKNKYVMPLKLPKEFSPRRKIDHRSELKLGSIPLVQAPYCMSQLELSKLCARHFLSFLMLG